MPLSRLTGGDAAFVDGKTWGSTSIPSVAWLSCVRFVTEVPGVAPSI